MPVSYYNQLKAQLTEAATAKKAALDAAYDRATTATFDASGNATYRKDVSGNNMYGTRDVQFLEQKRTTAAGAESRGTLRSGQNLRNVVNDEAAYRSDIATAAANLATQKNTIDEETGTKSAEYLAMYGDGKSPGGTPTPAAPKPPGPGASVPAPRATTGPGGSLITNSGGKAMADAYKKFMPSYGAPAKTGAKPTTVAPKRPKYQPGR